MSHRRGPRRSLSDSCQARNAPKPTQRGPADRNQSMVGSRQLPCVTEETGHGRAETRNYIPVPVPKSLPGLELWNGLNLAGVVITLTLG